LDGICKTASAGSGLFGGTDCEEGVGRGGRTDGEEGVGRGVGLVKWARGTDCEKGVRAGVG